MVLQHTFAVADGFCRGARRHIAHAVGRGLGGEPSVVVRCCNVEEERRIPDFPPVERDLPLQAPAVGTVP
jgi:hypothetical protein